MKTSTKIFVGLILLAIVAFIGFKMTGNVTAEPGIYDEFAQCLTDNDFKMFGAYWCPHCQSQEEMFGNSWDNVNYIECSLPNKAGQTAECINEGIEAYPTWEFSDGTRQTGVFSLEQLSQLSGCDLPA